MSHHVKRVCVISLDGVPGELLTRAFGEGRLAPLASLWGEGGAAEITSSLPPISSVAWATYSTGTGPGRHGVYGFVDRDPATREQYILSSQDVGAPRLWELLAGKAAVVNIPLTYPASPLDGWLVAGFPAPELTRAAWPPELGGRLAREGYLVDPDPAAASDPPEFFRQVNRALGWRRKLARELIGEDWVFCHLHIMATDRVNHFFLRDGLTGGRWADGFWEVYEGAAALVGELARKLPPGSELVLMSDHGFAPIDWEVDINAFLIEAGFLRLSAPGQGPGGVAPDSVAYSLTPGRIYLLRRGRERDGWINRDVASERLAALREALSSLATPDGRPAIAHLFMGSDIYRGPRAELGPDLLAIAAPGVELRGGWEGGEVVRPASRQGGHTLEGAFLWIRGREPHAGSILDVPPTLWALLGLPPHPQFEGQVLIG